MDVEVEEPHAHHRSGHHWVDLIVPVAALFISFVSILIAFHHGQVMKELVDQNARLVQANSLPYLELGYSSAEAPGIARRRAIAMNSGVGPAQIRSVGVSVLGKPVSDVGELLAACCGGKRGHVSTSTLFGRMLRAGDTITYLDFGPASDTEVAREFISALMTDRIVVDLCYCSVFDECWTQSSKGQGSNAPKRVGVCPVREPQYRY